MKRTFATALASVALLAFVSTQAASTTTQQSEQAATPRTGQKVTKPVQTSCPMHPEVKTRSAGKCPKCRMEERKQSAARTKGNGKVQPRPQQHEGADANE